MARRVREPIQVYLTAAERTELDRAARDLGVSRSEALRQGIAVLRRTAAWGRRLGPLADLASEGVVTPPRAEACGPPPRGAPVAPLCGLLGELRADRDDR
jgi:hypothetical protein